jgi:hypothetical protein
MLSKLNVLFILQPFEITPFIMAICLCPGNGILECWDIGVKAEINPFNCKKLLQTRNFYPACPVKPKTCLTGVKLFSISPGPLLHHSIIPLFQLGGSQ